MGFRDLQCFNQALLAKQLWRLLTHPNSLVCKVLRAKYFPSCSLMEAEVKHNSSWFWKSVSGSKKLLAEGLRNRVGNGERTNVWWDCWVPGLEGGRIRSQEPGGCEVQKVAQLIKDARWDVDLLYQLFDEREVEEILKIPISQSSIPDSYFWVGTKHGNYSVKTGYVEAKRMINQKGQKRNASSSRLQEYQGIWKEIWHLDIKPKVKHFIWKATHGILPTKEAMVRRVRNGDKICPRCGNGEETTEHTLFWCAEVLIPWKLFPIQWDGVAGKESSFMNWWFNLQEAKSRANGRDHIELTAYFLWHMWKVRNRQVFKRESVDYNLIVQNAMLEWREFKEKGRGGAGKSGGRIQEQGVQEGMGCSKGSLNGVYLRTDAAVHNGKRKAGWGISIWFSENQLIEAWAIPKVYGRLVELEEADGIRIKKISKGK